MERQGEGVRVRQGEGRGNGDVKGTFGREEGAREGVKDCSRGGGGSHR
jgi:hypothetical protein